MDCNENFSRGHVYFRYFPPRNNLPWKQSLIRVQSYVLCLPTPPSASRPSPPPLPPFSNLNTSASLGSVSWRVAIGPVPHCVSLSLKRTWSERDGPYVRDSHLWRRRPALWREKRGDLGQTFLLSSPLSSSVPGPPM